MKSQGIHSPSANKNKLSCWPAKGFGRIVVLMALTLAAILMPIGYKGADLNPTVATVEAAQNSTYYTIKHLRRFERNLILMLFWANKFGHIDLKNKRLIVCTRSMLRAGPDIPTEYFFSAEGIRINPKSFVRAGPDIPTEYTYKDGKLTVNTKSRNDNLFR